MMDTLFSALDFIPHWLGTMILGALPITELRGAIPAAMFGWHLTWYAAFIFAVIGNLLPLIPLYFGLDWLRHVLERLAPSLARLLDKRIERAKNKLQARYEKHGAIALCIFTAVPLPFTGLWSATLGAVALKIPFKYAGPAITLGILIAGVLITTLAQTGVMVF